MRKTRVGKRIFVQGAPLDTSWFSPYCCATVDTPSVTLRGTGAGRVRPLMPVHCSAGSGPDTREACR
jgi:hypothetical protein